MTDAFPPKPKAVIFDWDDTLVDTWRVVFTALNTTLRAMGAEAWTEEEAHDRLGPPARELFTGLFGDRWQEADKIYVKAYEDNIAKLVIHARVPEILDALQEQGIPFFVVSAKRGYLLRKEAAELKLEKFFAGMAGAGDAAQDKPHADAVLYALKDSGIAPGPDVWFLGDSKTDIVAARNAGCKAVLVDTKPPAPDIIAQYPPDIRFKSHDDILKAVKSWASCGAKPAPPKP